MTEKSRILRNPDSGWVSSTMSGAVYVHTVDEKRIVAIRFRPAFRLLLEIAATREGSDIVMVHDRKEDVCIGYSNVRD